MSRLRLPAYTIASPSPRGVCPSGLEFASGTLPGVQGTNFTENSSTDYSYAAGKNLKLFRVPFLWERAQPTKSSSLDSTYMGYLDDQVTWAKANGGKILFECHNFGKRSISGTSHAINDGTLTYSDFNDLWTRIATRYLNEIGVWGYSIMNEPNGMPIATTSGNYNTTATWTIAAQGAINAIRAVDTNKNISVCTDNFSGFQNFLSTYGGNPWTDSANKLWIELHAYFDSDNSGSYSGANKYWSGSGRSITYGGDTIKPVLDWAKTNSVNILIGETAVPDWDDSWKALLNDFYATCNQYTNVIILYWAFGSWYSSPGTISPLNTYTQDRNQMSVVSSYVSAAP